MERVVLYMALFSVLIPVFVGVRTYKYRTRTTTVVLVLSITSLVCDAFAYLWAVIFKNNYWVIHFYAVAEIAIVSAFFAVFLGSSKVHALMLLLLVVYVGELVISADIFHMNPYVKGGICLIVIILCGCGYWMFYQSNDLVFLDSIPEFWFVTGLLTYFSGALFSWLLFLVLHDPSGQGLGIWAFHNIANILKNILFAIGLWKARAAA